MTEWAELRAAGIAHAERTLSAHADIAELRGLVARWVDATPSPDSSPLDEAAARSATMALADQFDCRGLGQVAEALRLLDQREGAIPPGRWMLACLLGFAAADRYGDGLALGERRSIELRGLESYGAWDTFAAELLARLRSDATAREGFWRELAGLVETIRTGPERATLSAYKRSVREAVEAHRKAPDAAEAWETWLDSRVLLEEAFLFTLARRLNLGRYLEHLGQLPHPVFVWQCVEQERSGDLPDLIRAAPAAFNRTGTYQLEGMVLISLLRACAAECRRRAWGGGTPRPVDPDDEASLEPARAELEALADAALDALFDRDDAVPVAWLWLERLIFEGEHRGFWRCDRQQGTGLVLDPLMGLISRLSARLQLRADQLNWIHEARDLWRIDRIAAVLAVAAQHEPIETEARGVLLRELLIEVKPVYTGATEAMERPDCVVGRIGAAHVLRTAEPESFIQNLWHELRPVRERAWRAGGEKSRNSVAELAVLWGVCAMEMAAADLKRRLWLALTSILESAMQTDHPSSPGGFWPAALRRLCRSAASILSGKPHDDLEVLAQLVRPRVRADDLLFEMVFTLQNGGIDGQVIEAAVARWGLGLDNLARRYLAMEALRVERGDLARPWLDHVRSLVPLDQVPTANAVPK